MILIYFIRINRRKVNDLLFGINVFRDDLLWTKLIVIRASPYDDGKIINGILTEFTQNDEYYGHYVMIESMSFLRTNPDNGKLYYFNSSFYKICFEHF